MESSPVENSLDSHSENPKSEEKGGVFSRPEYATKEFWNGRFDKHKAAFDWYLEYKELKAYFESVFPVKKTDKILMVGCGNAKLSEEMYDDGYFDVINIDISDKVITQMNEIALKKNKTMTFLEMDATKMTFESEYFDVIIDKGTLDALICGKDYGITDGLLVECMRVLKKEGRFLIITHGNPEGRRYIYQRSLGFENYDYQFCKQRLSETAQLINIMRSNLVDKPLNHIMKDKTALLKTMIEFMKMKKQKSEGMIKKRIVIEDKENDDPNSEFYYLKPVVLKATEENPEDDHQEEEKSTMPEEKEKSISAEQKAQKNEESETTISDISEGIKPANHEEREVKNTDGSEKNNEEKKDGNTAEQKEDNGEEKKKTIYNPIRQSFCFIYEIRKKNE